MKHIKILKIMFEVELTIEVDVQEVFDNLSTVEKMNFLKENLDYLTRDDIEMENFTDMPFGEKIYEGGNLHRMYISEILNYSISVITLFKECNLKFKYKN